MGPTTAFVVTLLWASAGSISLDTVIAALVAGVAAEVLLGVFDEDE
jgi:hypothetical protein